MTLIDLGPIAAEPVSLADLKRWCRIDRDDEDELIEALSRAARETIEAETRLVLARRPFRLVVDEVPADGRIPAERQPLVSVNACLAFDEEGDPHAFGPGDVVVERVAGSDALRLSRAVRAKAANGIEIEFEAGFAPDAVPEALKTAIRRIVSVSYELRGALEPAEQPGFVPPAVRALVAPFRRVRI